MNQNKKTFYKNQAQSIINKLTGRKMEGFYCDTMEDAKKKGDE